MDAAFSPFLKKDLAAMMVSDKSKMTWMTRNRFITVAIPAGGSFRIVFGVIKLQGISG